jgi:hypothetical protein
VAGEADPHVAVPPLVLVHASEQVRDDLPVAHRDGAARPFFLPGAGDQDVGVLGRREQGLGRAVALVALPEERGRRLGVRALEGANLERLTHVL